MVYSAAICSQQGEKERMKVRDEQKKGQRESEKKSGNKKERKTIIMKKNPTQNIFANFSVFSHSILCNRVGEDSGGGGYGRVLERT